MDVEGHIRELKVLDFLIVKYLFLPTTGKATFGKIVKFKEALSLIFRSLYPYIKSSCILQQ